MHKVSIIQTIMVKVRALPNALQIYVSHPWVITCQAPKLCAEPFITFRIILLTDRQTNKQMGR